MNPELKKPPKRVPRLELSKAGNLEDLLEVLWKAVKTAEAFLDDPDKETRFRGIHATAQAGGVYRNLLETFEFKDRLETVEEQLAGKAS
jgi:hypothetical protein